MANFENIYIVPVGYAVLTVKQGTKELFQLLWNDGQVKLTCSPITQVPEMPTFIGYGPNSKKALRQPNEAEKKAILNAELSFMKLSDCSDWLEGQYISASWNHEMRDILSNNN